MYDCFRRAAKNLPLHLLAQAEPKSYEHLDFTDAAVFFVVVSVGVHFQDRPILPEVHDFSDLPLGCLVKFGFAALGPFSRGRSHMGVKKLACFNRKSKNPNAKISIYSCLASFLSYEMCKTKSI